jgi:hypothetical protein
VSVFLVDDRQDHLCFFLVIRFEKFLLSKVVEWVRPSDARANVNVIQPRYIPIPVLYFDRPKIKFVSNDVWILHGTLLLRKQDADAFTVVNTLDGFCKQWGNRDDFNFVR